LLTHDPKYLFRHSPEIQFNPKAECPKFLKFVESVLGKADIALAKKYFGSMFLGANTCHGIMVIRGTPGGGKSSLVTIVEKVLGEHLVAYLRTLHLGGRFETSAFLGKRLLVGKDVPGDALSVSGARMLKSLSGNDLMQAEIKFAPDKQALRGDFHVIIVSNNQLRIRGASRNGQIPLSTFARCAPRARIITFELDRVALQAKASLGTLWKDGEGNPDAIEKAKIWGNSLNNSLLQIAGEQITWLGQFKQLLSSVFRESAMLLSPSSAIGLKLTKFQNNFVELAAGYEDLIQFASIRREQIDKASDFHLAISLLIQKLPTGWGMIREWCSWQKVRSEALQIGLDTVVSKLESKDGTALDVPALFERSFRKALLFSIIEQSSALREFFGSEQNENIEQFRNIDAMVSDLTREIIQARLSNRIPQENLVHDVPKSEIGLLRREAGKKMRHIPVRQLLSRIPTLLPRLKPCVLMSPLSVAQYLEPSHATFDVVIFDEASQIPVWDAVGAIARGQQLIVVGDPKQLPPTNFFNSSDSDEHNLKH